MASDFPKAILCRIGSYVNYKIIPLDKNEVVIGRAKESTCNIADLLISRRHAIFKIVKDEWTVESVGMNGIAVNHVTLPKYQPIPLNHLDVIELGAGSKFVYAFRLLSAEVNEPHAKKRRLPLTNQNVPTIKDSPEAFRSWMASKRNLERTLAEENDQLDQKLVETSTREDQLALEQQKLTEYAANVTRQLENQFAQEKKLLEDKVIRGEMENNELQNEKSVLEQRMTESLKNLEAECLRKTLELEASVAKANAEKQALLEQKEIVVQQLQRENEVLEGKLEEERRFSAATFDELTKLKEGRQSLEEQLQQERLKFEEEKKVLLQQGSEAESRLVRLEEERAVREQLLNRTKADLEAKELEVVDIQSRAAVALDVYQAIRNLSGDDSKEPTTVTISCDAVGEAAPNAFPEAFPHVAELELEEMREKLRATMAEKELIKQQLENASTKARKDFVVKMEDVVENELQCGICSELLVFAVSLNCMHTFCQFCISQWKKNKVECPICRAPIKTEGRSFVIDSAIDGIVSTLSEEMQQRRKELIQQRREIAIQTANNQDHKSTLATARSRGSRGGRQPARGPVPSVGPRPSGSSQNATSSTLHAVPVAGPSGGPSRAVTHSAPARRGRAQLVRPPSVRPQSVRPPSVRPPSALVPSQMAHVTGRAVTLDGGYRPFSHSGGSMYVVRPVTNQNVTSVPVVHRR